MQLRLAIILFCSAATAAFAQPVPQQTPPEVALQINTVVGTWAQTLVMQGRQIEELNRQIASLREKCGKTCEPGAPAK